MAFELIDLPYDDTALEPAVSAKTLSYHHGKHHKAYLDKTNKAIEGTAHEGKKLEEVVAAARDSDQGLFNNSAQSWNHGFYWHSMAPEETSPSDEAQEHDRRCLRLGRRREGKARRTRCGHFASGWVWLAVKDGKLTIEETHDGDTLADLDGVNPLLVIDLWEHAYYLDHQNARPAYLEAVNGKLNWSFASENLARGTTWEYPC